MAKRKRQYSSLTGDATFSGKTLDASGADDESSSARKSWEYPDYGPFTKYRKKSLISQLNLQPKEEVCPSPRVTRSMISSTVGDGTQQDFLTGQMDLPQGSTFVVTKQGTVDLQKYV